MCVETNVQRLTSFLLFTFLIGCVQPDEGPTSAFGNSDPIIQSLTVDPAQFAVGASSTVTVVATDPDGQPLTYRWRASTGDIIGEGSTVRYTASFCCVGPNLINVTVRDNAGGRATQNVDIFIFY
jgi:hypothetical protein